MTARDEPPVTVPPPAGEDDAYSATTKVGAMPPDIMEKLRAEGLLPEETKGDRETPVNSFRPSTSLEQRTPARADAAADSGAPIPTLFSSPPSALPAEPAEGDRETKPVALSGPPAPLETPVAFAAPPEAEPAAFPTVPPKTERPSAVDPEEKTTTARRAELVANEPAPPSKTTLYVVAVLVLILMIVALIRLRG